MRSPHPADNEFQRGSNPEPWNDPADPCPREGDGDQTHCNPHFDTSTLQRIPFKPEIILAERAEIYLGPKLGRSASERILRNLPADTCLDYFDDRAERAIRTIVTDNVESSPFVEADLQEAAAVVSAWMSAEGASQFPRACRLAAIQIIARAQTVDRLNSPVQPDAPVLFSDILHLSEQLVQHPILAETALTIESDYLYSVAQRFLEKGFSSTEIENSPPLRYTLCDFVVRSLNTEATLEDLTPAPVPCADSKTIESLTDLLELLDVPAPQPSTADQCTGMKISDFLRFTQQSTLDDSRVPVNFIDTMSIAVAVRGCELSTFSSNNLLASAFAIHLAETTRRLTELEATEELISAIGHCFNRDGSWRESSGEIELFAYLDERDQERLPHYSGSTKQFVERLWKHPIVTMPLPLPESEPPGEYTRRLGRLFVAKGFTTPLLEASTLIAEGGTFDEGRVLDEKLCLYISETYDALERLGLARSLIKSHGHRFSPDDAARVIEDVQHAFAETNIIATVVTEVLEGRFGDYDHAVGKALSHFAQILEEATELFKEIDPNHHWAVSAANKVFRQKGKRTLEDTLGYYTKRKDRREAKKARKKGVFACEALLRDDTIPKLVGRNPSEASEEIFDLARVIAKRLIERSGKTISDWHSTEDDIQQAAALEGIEMLSQKPTSTREIVARMVLAAQKEASQYSRYHEKGEIQAGLQREDAEIGHAPFRDE